MKTDNPGQLQMYHIDRSLSHIGSLMYLAVATSPDLSYTVNVLSKFLERSSSAHWTAAKKVLKYLKGTFNILESHSIKIAII